MVPGGHLERLQGNRVFAIGKSLLKSDAVPRPSAGIRSRFFCAGIALVLTCAPPSPR
jgi:hypothetical protein